MAQAPVIERTDDACFARMDAAYDAYKNNGLRGSPDSLIPHLYKLLEGNLPGVFCYQVNTEDVPSSVVVGTYLGGRPGETMFEGESRSAEPQTPEQLEEQNGAWAGYVSDENLCCGPEKSFYYCSPRLGRLQNITDCIQEPRYAYEGPGRPSQTTTLAVVFSDGSGADGSIFCGCVLDRNTTNPIASVASIPDPKVIEGIIQQYSKSGSLVLTGILPVLVALTVATIV